MEEVLRVWDRSLEFSEGLLTSLKESYAVSFVSFCPQRRAWARNLGIKRVLNPYQFWRWPTSGVISNELVWWHDWQSFLGKYWQECRFLLLSNTEHHIFHQSFKLQSEEGLLTEVFQVSPGPLLHHDSLPRVPLVSHPFKVLCRHVGEEERGLLIKDPRRWPRKPHQELFIPYSVEDHSELYALGASHRILLGARSSLGRWDDELLSWFLAGRPQGDLLKWWSENQSRRYPHPQSRLSRAARHWHSFIKKWALSICSLLWRSRRRKEAQGLDFGVGLHDESRAFSHESDQRAA